MTLFIEGIRFGDTLIRGPFKIDVISEDNASCNYRWKEEGYILTKVISYQVRNDLHWLKFVMGSQA